MPQEHLTVEQYKASLGKRKPYAPAPASTPRELWVTIPVPDRTTHPNARPHFRTLAKYKKQQRADACAAAMAAMQQQGFASPPQWPRATIHATFYRHRPNDRLADGDGLIAWLKASCDGLADAGVVANDRGLTWLAPSQVLGKEAVESKVVLTIVSLNQEVA